MFKMGCQMAKKILAIDGKNSSSSSSGEVGDHQASGSSKKTKDKLLTMGAGEDSGGGNKAKSGDELNDFSKLQQDPRVPLNVRQIFKITKSWKAIARTMSKTGTAMFLNLFEQNQDLFYLFDRFQHLKGKELHDSMELKEHASTVMSTLDQSINLLSDYDNFVTYLHSIGKLHRKVPEFKREHFWKIEQPFLKAVKQTLDERCNETIEEIYKIAIKLIIETIADGYGQDEEVGEARQQISSDPSNGRDNGKSRNGSGSAPDLDPPQESSKRGNQKSQTKACPSSNSAGKQQDNASSNVRGISTCTGQNKGYNELNSSQLPLCEPNDASKASNGWAQSNTSNASLAASKLCAISDKRRDASFNSPARSQSVSGKPNQFGKSIHHDRDGNNDDDDEAARLKGTLFVLKELLLLLMAKKSGSEARNAVAASASACPSPTDSELRYNENGCQTKCTEAKCKSPEWKQSDNTENKKKKDNEDNLTEVESGHRRNSNDSQKVASDWKRQYTAPLEISASNTSLPTTGQLANSSLNSQCTNDDDDERQCKSPSKPDKSDSSIYLTTSKGFAPSELNATIRVNNELPLLLLHSDSENTNNNIAKQRNQFEGRGGGERDKYALDCNINSSFHVLALRPNHSTTSENGCLANPNNSQCKLLSNESSCNEANNNNNNGQHRLKLRCPANAKLNKASQEQKTLSVWAQIKQSSALFASKNKRKTSKQLNHSTGEFASYGLNRQTANDENPSKSNRTPHKFLLTTDQGDLGELIKMLMLTLVSRANASFVSKVEEGQRVID